MPNLAGNKHPFHPSLPSWDAPFLSFDRNWTVPISQRRTSKCLFPRRRFYLQLYKRYSLNGKGKIIPYLGKKKQNNKNMECMTLNNMANIHDHHPQAHFINNNNGSLVLTLWKWRETSSTTSLLLIRTSSTSGFRNGSVFNSSGRILCSNEEWFRNHSVFTTARQSNSSSDVTRLVATEHVRNKYSLLESIHLKSVNLRTASI